ncbi:hypothetical protein EYD10_05629 [Varanus komodoensis]|nr:hypothetical protein EYD10_05629 [Varanus komodoensis]
MRAGVGYRIQECSERGSPSCEILWGEEKALPSAQAPASESQELRATQSFQALRQQTLKNVNMVQSEINEILNKNITDMKSPEFNPDHSFLTSTPISIAMSRAYQEGSHFKKQLHPESSSATSHYPENNVSAIVGNTITTENTPHHILLKYNTVGKPEIHTQSSRNKAVLSSHSDQVLKNSADNICSPSVVHLETERVTSPRKIRNYDEHKMSMALYKHEEEEEEHLIENMSYYFKDMKDNKKSPRHELSGTFELQNSLNVCGKDNDSGYLSEQDLIEKAVDASNEDFKSRKISELEDSVGEFHISMVSSREHNQNEVQTAFENKYLDKELLMKGNAVDKPQLQFLSKVEKDQLLFTEHMEERQIDRQKQLLSPQKELQHEILEFCDVNAVSDDYIKKARLLPMSLRESECIQKKVINLEHENGDLKNQMKPLTDIMQSLTEQNSKYQKQIKDLHDEKNNLQGRLVKSEGDCKECLKEVKRLLKKCKELLQQKSTLEENQDQLYAQNQRLMREINDLQKKDQNAQESLASFTKEKVDLTVTIESLKTKLSVFQEENKMLQEEIGQLTDKNSLLEKELGLNRNEIQQLKNNEKAVNSDLEALHTRIQSLKEEKLNLDKRLQEAINAKEFLQKQLSEAQSSRANAEENLLTECKNAKIEIGALKSNLSNMERECERQRKVLTDITDDNWLLKKELHEYKQEVSECKNKIRQLNEELLLMENEMRSTENERDILQFEARRLHRNNAILRDQVTTLVNEQYKRRYSFGSQGQNDHLDDPKKICEEISSYHHISLIHNPPGFGKIAEIRRKLGGDKLCPDKKCIQVKKFYSAFSVSCTTSIIRKSGFPTALRKKIQRSLLCHLVR